MMVKSLPELQTPVLDLDDPGRKGINLDTKLKVYKIVVLPTLLYVCGTWAVQRDFVLIIISCLRKKSSDNIPDTEDLKKAGRMQSIHTALKLAQLRGTGPVIRMLPSLMNDFRKTNSMENCRKLLSS